LSKGDAFNQALLDISRSRVGRLGFFEDVNVEPFQGSAPDRARVQVSVVEQPTGELAFGAGFSSTDAFLVDFSISERNLRGRGQFLRLRVSASSRRQQIDIRFTEPRFLDRNLAAGFDIFQIRSDFSREASFETESTGFSLRAGFPLTRAVQASVSYTLRTDEVRTFTGVSESIAAGPQARGSPRLWAIHSRGTVLTTCASRQTGFKSASIKISPELAVMFAMSARSSEAASIETCSGMILCSA
jgi:outer membrane protein insertion porin family